MKRQIYTYINARAEKFHDDLLKLIPKAKHQELKTLYDSFKNSLNEALLSKKFYVGFPDGHVESFLTLSEISQKLDYSINTLEVYLTKSQGFAQFNGYTLSITPLDQVPITITESAFWFRAHSDNKVTKFNSLLEVATRCNIKATTLCSYLSKGKGIAKTKAGIVSCTKLVELSEEEKFTNDYLERHGRLPYGEEIPDTPYKRKK